MDGPAWEHKGPPLLRSRWLLVAISEGELPSFKGVVPGRSDILQWGGFSPAGAGAAGIAPEGFFFFLFLSEDPEYCGYGMEVDLEGGWEWNGYVQNTTYQILKIKKKYVKTTKHNSDVTVSAPGKLPV